MRDNMDYVWHLWLNRWSRENGHNSSMYKFKQMLNFLKYGWVLLEKAFTGTLPTVHQQCSHSTPEKIVENKLLCVLGKNVCECPFLLSIKATCESQPEHSKVTEQEMYQIMANTCAWHIFTESQKRFVDTSGGWLTDESDRMYWRNVYENLASAEEQL